MDKRVYWLTTNSFVVGISASIWGVLSWAITPPIQSHLIQLSPETSDIQQSLNNSALHFGIAFGTFIGSIVADQLSIEQNAHIGVLFAALALVSFLLSTRRERNSENTCYHVT